MHLPLSLSHSLSLSPSCVGRRGGCQAAPPDDFCVCVRVCVCVCVCMQVAAVRQVREAMQEARERFGARCPPAPPPRRCARGMSRVLPARHAPPRFLENGKRSDSGRKSASRARDFAPDASMDAVAGTVCGRMRECGGMCIRCEGDERGLRVWVCARTRVRAPRPGRKGFELVRGRAGMGAADVRRGRKRIAGAAPPRLSLSPPRRRQEAVTWPSRLLSESPGRRGGQDARLPVRAARARGGRCNGPRRI